MDKERLKSILEAVLMAASAPLTIEALMNIFEEDQRPQQDEFMAALDELAGDCAARSYELKKVNSGYRFQVKKDYADFVSRLWEDKPARYSRALLETLALIAYRQPITRGEIEAVRGVSVSSQIIKTLDEREWIKVVGHRDVPGKPALYATTKAFLDYFNLESLDDLPSLQEIRDIDAINAELDLRMPRDEAANTEQTEADNVSDEEQSADETDGGISLSVADASEQVAADAEQSEIENSEAEDMAAAEHADVMHQAMSDTTEHEQADITVESADDDSEAQDEHLESASARAEH